MKPRLASVTSLQPNPPPLQLLRNLACDVSGLLFDLDFTHDLGPYLTRHPRFKQIQEYAPLLVYADPRHCTAECLESWIRASIESYPLLAITAWDRLKPLAPYLSGAGFRKDAAGTHEHHRLVLFSSAAPAEPLGFLWLGRQIEGDLRKHGLDLVFSLEMAFVRPEHRGLGYGTALTVAAGMCCSWEIRHQAERYAKGTRRHVPLTIRPRLAGSDSRCPALTTTLREKLKARINEDRAILRGIGTHVLDLDTMVDQ